MNRGERILKTSVDAVNAMMNHAQALYPNDLVEQRDFVYECLGQIQRDADGALSMRTKA